VDRFLWKPASPDSIVPDEIAEILNSSGVVLLPTDTIYGLHAVASDSAAIARIYRLKARDAGKALPVLFSSVEQLLDNGVRLSDHLRETLGAIWPAPLTAILPIADPLPATAGASTVAARIPDLIWLRTLIQKTGPLASTSANLAGGKSAASIQEVDPGLMAGVSAVVDSGPVISQPSTLVDFTKIPPRVVREGAFSFTQNLWKTL